MSVLQVLDFKAMGLRVPAAEFKIEDIPSLSGKVFIVTGGNTGLGKETCRVLLLHDAKVYLAARSPEKAQAAIDDLAKITEKGDNIEFLKLDLANVQASVDAAKEFMGRESRLDVLVNSAGVMEPPKGSKTSDGFDMQFGTNVLGHFAFTTALLPVLLSTAKESQPGSVRVVNVSSSGHFVYTDKQGIHYDSLTNSKQSLTAYYGMSKLGNILFSNELARRYKDVGILSVSLHPGNIVTDLQRHVGTQSLKGRFLSTILYPLELGALTQLYCATSPEVTMADTGGYYVPWARKYHPSHPKAEDPKAMVELWEYCEAQVKDHSS